MNPYDKILCRINIRPKYKGCKARPNLVNAYNGKIILMEALWLMDKDDKYPGEWALWPVDKQEQLKLSKFTGWIASGDVDILIYKTTPCDVHSENENKFYPLRIL